MTTMDQDHPLQLEPDASATEVAGGGGSVLDKIKKRRTGEADTAWVDIPSWGGDLKAEYKVLDPDYVQKMIRGVQARQRQAGGKKYDSTPDLDFLIEACIGVKAYDAETDEEQYLTPGYTMDLASMLDPQDEFGNPVSIKDQRTLVAYLLKYNGIALASHAQKLARWMQDTAKPIEDPQ